VWVAGNGPTDQMLLEFRRNGKFLMMIGGSFDGLHDNNSKVPSGVVMPSEPVWITMPHESP